jgi:cellulose synthase/poly-beta-1,6-N-acetylglucosamine synthase-like glycosyltransferase
LASGPVTAVTPPGGFIPLTANAADELHAIIPGWIGAIRRIDRIAWSRPVREYRQVGIVCSMQPLVYIVILNWNGYLDTLRCVASLEQQQFTNFRILIIDNGSTDGSIEVLRGLGDRVCLIENSNNLGYTGGNNRAMREAFDRGADYVWLFNNDAVAEPDTLIRMVDACEADVRIGLASPLIPKRTIAYNSPAAWSTSGCRARR